MARTYPSVRPGVAWGKRGRSRTVRPRAPEGQGILTSGVGADDVIRVLHPRAVRLYHDRMTVAAFADEVGDLRAALTQLLRSYRAGWIAFQAGRGARQ